MHYNFFQWIDGPDIYDRAFIEQKYMFKYAKQPWVFQRWKPYVPDPIEEVPVDKGNAPTSETDGRPNTPRRPGGLQIEEVSYVRFAS